MLEDRLTINKLRDGNYDTFEMLFAKWYTPLSNYAYSIVCNVDEAEDIVQSVFYILWDKRINIEIHTSIKSYLYRMVHNSCMNKLKQHKIRAEHNHIYAREVSNPVNFVDNSIIGSELQRQIEMVINNLPPRCKEVFKLSRFKQMPYAKIAEELNISVNTVETQVVKALRLLRQELKDYLPFILLLCIVNG